MSIEQWRAYWWQSFTIGNTVGEGVGQPANKMVIQLGLWYNMKPDIRCLPSSSLVLYVARCARFTNTCIYHDRGNYYFVDNISESFGALTRKYFKTVWFTIWIGAKQRLWPTCQCSPICLMCSVSLLYIDSFFTTGIHRNPNMPPEGPCTLPNTKKYRISTKNSMYMGDSYISGPLHTVLVLSLWIHRSFI